MTEERMVKCIAIADHYGYETQCRKVVEEMAELTQALCKGNKEKIVEELADVEIMIYQLRYLLKRDRAVDKVTDKKLERQLERIGMEKSRYDCMGV